MRTQRALIATRDELADAIAEIDRLETDLWLAQRDAAEAQRIMFITEETALCRRYTQ
jgi:hypothetical protein